VPLLGEGMGPHLTQFQCGLGRVYMNAKFHLDPSNRLATIHQRDRQTARQTAQWSDSIGNRGSCFTNGRLKTVQTRSFEWPINSSFLSNQNDL